VSAGQADGLAAGMEQGSRVLAQTEPRPGRLWGGVAVGVAFVIFLWWEFLHRGVYAYSTALYPFDDADEWRYTACSRLVEHGYSLFDQVFSAQPPLFFVSLASGMRLFGDSITGARATEIIFGAVALGATAWTAYELAGPIAAGAAALALAVSPAFLIYSHTVEAEVPMMAFVTLSLALALAYRRTDRLALLVLSGLSLAAATLIKLFALEAVLPVLWMIAVQSPSRRNLARDVAVFGASAVLPVLIELALVSPGQQWQQVVTLHDRVASLRLPNLVPPTTILKDFLTFDAGLTAVALAGLLTVILARRIGDAVFLGLWSVGGLIMLLFFRPLFPHHAAILSSSLAVCAGVGAGVLAERWREKSWLSAPLVAAALAYLALLPRLVHADLRTLQTPPPSSLSVLAAYVQRTTPTTAFVASDNVRVAEQAHRLVPPPLCDPSNVRLLAGFMTAGDLIAATERYRAQLVIPLGNYNSVPGYLRWVKAHYRPVQVLGGGLVYRRRPGL
jgi:4-amino-4-deoxy-L-arabinose transferase-like glycosyltransferase